MCLSYQSRVTGWSLHVCFTCQLGHEDRESTRTRISFERKLPRSIIDSLGTPVSSSQGHHLLKRNLRKIWQLGKFSVAFQILQRTAETLHRNQFTFPSFLAVSLNWFEGVDMKDILLLYILWSRNKLSGIVGTKEVHETYNLLKRGAHRSLRWAAWLHAPAISFRNRQRYSLQRDGSSFGDLLRKLLKRKHQAQLPKTSETRQETFF